MRKAEGERVGSEGTGLPMEVSEKVEVVEGFWRRRKGIEERR